MVVQQDLACLVDALGEVVGSTLVRVDPGHELAVRVDDFLPRISRASSLVMLSMGLPVSCLRPPPPSPPGFPPRHSRKKNQARLAAIARLIQGTAALNSANSQGMRPVTTSTSKPMPIP